MVRRKTIGLAITIMAIIAVVGVVSLIAINETRPRIDLEYVGLTFESCNPDNPDVGCYAGHFFSLITNIDGNYSVYIDGELATAYLRYDLANLSTSDTTFPIDQIPIKLESDKTTTYTVVIKVYTLSLEINPEKGKGWQEKVITQEFGLAQEKSGSFSRVIICNALMPWYGEYSIIKEAIKIVILAGIAIFFVGLIVYIMTWKPEMAINSWGDPDPGEACGYCVMATIALILVVFVMFGTLGLAFALLGGW